MLPGQFNASVLSGRLGRVVTVQGDSIISDGRHSGVLLNRNTNVVAADISASNGVIHVIDRVLLPH